MFSYRSFSSITSCALFLLFFLRVTVHADDITVAPMRVIFEKSQREAEVTLVNSSDEPGTYRLSLINYVQSKSQGFTEVSDATAKQYSHFADKMIRFSPRQVLLPAHGSQVVRLQLRLPPKLIPGEYRTHLAITNVPAPILPAPAAAPGKSTKKRMQIAITVVNRLAIPVIIRRGDDDAVAYGVKDLKLDISKNKTPAELGDLHFTLVAKGTRSSFSEIEITFRPEKELEEFSLSKMSGVAIYFPNAERDIDVKLTLPPEVKGGPDYGNGDEPRKRQYFCRPVDPRYSEEALSKSTRPDSC